MKYASVAWKYSRDGFIKVAGPLLMLALITGPIFIVGAEPAARFDEGTVLGVPGQTPPEEHGLGLLPSDPAEYPVVPLPAEIASVTELPPAVDLTEPSLMLMGVQPSGDGIPPVGDQGSTNTCVGWATSYYYKTYQEWLEQGWELRNGGPNYDHIFSVNFVYNQITNNDLECDDGAEIGDALDLIVEKGDVPWSTFPWNPTNCSIQPTWAQKQAALDYKGISYGYFFITTGPPSGPQQNHNLTPLKQWLADDDPFVLGLPVYAEFDYAGCYVPVMPPSDPGSFRGLHAVTGVGYDDSFGGVGAFKIVNSWGTDWGCDGYGWLSYEFVQKYAWEAWWMTSNRPPWIAPHVPDRYAQVGNWIIVDLTPYENDREDSGTDLNWYVVGGSVDHCLVHGEESTNDVLSFEPNPPDYTGYDDIILRLEDSEDAEDTQQLTLGWFNFTDSYALPLSMRDYSD